MARIRGGGACAVRVDVRRAQHRAAVSGDRARAFRCGERSTRSGRSRPCVAEPMQRDVIQLGRNFLLSLGGEGLQSGFHFILNLLLIRLLSPHDFGIFAIAFVLGGISLTYGNALVSTPAAVLIPRLKSRREADFQEVVFGSIAVMISTAITILVAGGLWFATGQVVEAIAG